MNDETIKRFTELLEKLKSFQSDTKTDQSPNIFYMLGIETKEILMCRMLKALIEPNGVHGLGTKPLELFLEEINYKIDKKERLNKAYVVLEETIDNARRVDIVIHIDKDVIPIEVKIGASDQPKQLNDYYNYYNNKGYFIENIFYLTPLGNDPSEDSLGDLSKDKVKIISFTDTIFHFLNELLESENISAEIKFIIKNLKAVLDNMGNETKNKDDIIKTVNEMVGTDSELKKSLFTMLKYSDDIRAELERKYFEESLIKSDGNYSVSIDSGDSDFAKHIDKHSKYIIRKGGEIVAYICVETNLYIVRKFTKEEVTEGWIKYPESEYAWKYIYKNNKRWDLRNIDIDIFNYDIKWSEYL